MAVKTMKVGPGALLIGATESATVFSGQVRSCRLVPNVDTDDPAYVLTMEQVEGDRTESWALEGELVQDFGSAESTTEWLFEHRGERHPFTFTPNNSLARQITGELVVEAIEVGGDVNTKPTSDFEFQLVGEPTFAAIPAG